MYVDQTLGGPDLADTDSTNTDTTTRERITAAIETTKHIANKVVSVLTSSEARWMYRLAITILVVGVGISLAATAHMVVRGLQGVVNVASFAVWWVTIMNFAQAKVLSYNATAKREPWILHIDFSTTSWCSVDAGKRVWAATAVLA